MMRTVMRLAPSQAGGRLLSGTWTGGGNAVALGIGVPCSFNVKLSRPLVTVPQFDGAKPGKGVSVQQVIRPRTKKKPPTARSIPTAIKTICTTEGRPNFMFLKKSILFIRVSCIPYPGQVDPGPPLPSVATGQNLLP